MTKENDIPFYDSATQPTTWLDHGSLRFVGSTKKAVDLYLNSMLTEVSYS